uniref:Candidate secreted effector n=1 Tax=Meloidogyne incognita TaxID=6306 RepID=A0A914MML0_MELIC
MDEVTTTEMNERNLMNISTSITETSTSKHKTSGNSSPKILNLSTTSAVPSNKEFTNKTQSTTASTHKVTTLSSTKLKDNVNNLSSVYPSEPLQNSPNYPSTTIYKRTTRSTRSSQNFTTITPSGSKGNWRSSISPFPWYFVAIGGFLFASIILFCFHDCQGI